MHLFEKHLQSNSFILSENRVCLRDELSCRIDSFGFWIQAFRSLGFHHQFIQKKKKFVFWSLCQRFSCFEISLFQFRLDSKLDQ